MVPACASHLQVSFARCLSLLLEAWLSLAGQLDGVGESLKNQGIPHLVTGLPILASMDLILIRMTLSKSAWKGLREISLIRDDHYV